MRARVGYSNAYRHVDGWSMPQMRGSPADAQFLADQAIQRRTARGLPILGFLGVCSKRTNAPSHRPSAERPENSGLITTKQAADASRSAPEWPTASQQGKWVPISGRRRVLQLKHPRRMRQAK